MRAVISSATNSRIKLAVSLQQRKHRESARLFPAEGLRLAEMAAESGWKVECGFYTAEAAKEERMEQLVSSLDKGCMMYEVPSAVFNRISDTRNPQGILLLIHMKEEQQNLEQLLQRKHPLLLVLDRIQDPGNAGTILRTADAAGVDGILLTKESVDIFSPKTVRASMGSIFHVPVYPDISVETLTVLAKERNLRLLAADLDDTAVPYDQQDYQGPSALIFGNEANGISGELREVSQKVHIPIYGKAESLNAAIAASIITYEAVRQRRNKKMS